MRINIQPIEKRELRADHGVYVHSIFYTIQGEGPLTGHPAIFVRLTGCNLQCPGCDTEYTTQRLLMQPEAVVREVALLHPGPRLVVITGGEPFRQDIGLLTQLLADSGYSVQIETNGTLAPPPGLAVGTWVVVSPKTGRVHPATAEIANAYKYVLSARSVAEDDGLPLQALDHTALPRLARPPESLFTETGYNNPFPRGAIYIQPMDEQDAEQNLANQRAVVESCMKHGYTLQLQLHKLLNME